MNEDQKHLTPEGIEVKIGQVWRDLDKRNINRRVKVEFVNSERATVRNVFGGNATYIQLRRMKKGSTGWALEPQA